MRSKSFSEYRMSEYVIKIVKSIRTQNRGVSVVLGCFRTFHIAYNEAINRKEGKMKKVKKAFQNTANHVFEYRGRYCAIATALFALSIINKNHRDFEKFLVSKSIDPTEYFFLEMYEEMLKNKAL